jgi:hypothetical protein
MLLLPWLAQMQLKLLFGLDGATISEAALLSVMLFVAMLQILSHGFALRVLMFGW